MWYKWLMWMHEIQCWLFWLFINYPGIKSFPQWPWLLNPLTTNIHLYCFSNQLTGFYMMGTLVVKGLIIYVSSNNHTFWQTYTSPNKGACNLNTSKEWNFIKTKQPKFYYSSLQRLDALYCLLFFWKVSNMWIPKIIIHIFPKRIFLFLSIISNKNLNFCNPFSTQILTLNYDITPQNVSVLCFI